MMLMEKLKTSNRERVEKRMTAEQHLRRNLISRLMEQKEIVEAEINGKQYQRTIIKFRPNPQTGQAEPVKVQKRIKRWYWKEETGTTCIQLYYGMKPIDLGADKSTIEVKTIDQLPEAIDTIIEAVDAGELDEALNKAKADRSLTLRGIKKACLEVPRVLHKQNTAEFHSLK